MKQQWIMVLSDKLRDKGYASETALKVATAIVEAHKELPKDQDNIATGAIVGAYMYSISKACEETRYKFI